MNASRKIFSIEEANALLPALETILSRLLEKKENHDRQHDHLFMDELLHEAIKHQRPQESEKKPDLEKGARAVDRSVLDLEHEIQEIRALGCILRNLEWAWVEFPAQRQGESIYFCWRRGETQVQYYRPSNTSKLERFPL